MVGDKIFFRTLFKNLFSDTFELQLWDQSTEIYGDGKPKFKIIFYEPIPKADIIKDPSLAFGEAYMEHKFDVEGSIEDVVESLYNNKDSFLGGRNSNSVLVNAIKNNLKNSKKNIEFHYDIGNDFYKLWLDDTMTYSCGYFKSEDDSLTAAQKNKVDHILKKLNLKEGETLLDIGCGWGGLLIEAAKQYKVKGLGITLSEEQYIKFKERIKEEHLEEYLEVRLMDYRDLKKSKMKFDRIVSVGMLEHVGRSNYDLFFENVDAVLKESGLFLLHYISGIKESEGDAWIKKYIFPGGVIPTLREIIYISAEYNYHTIDVESLRMHYTRTLLEWYKNFQNNKDKVKEMFDEKFIRMWSLYLCSCAAAFNNGVVDLHQILFSKGINNNLPSTRKYLYVKE